MGDGSSRRVPALVLLLALLVGWAAVSHAKAVKPITDVEVRARKLDCLVDIDNGMWGRRCKQSAIDRENCALRCVSAACYQLIYGADPLEEGEVEFHRGRDFRMCVRRESRGLPITMENLYE